MVSQIINDSKENSNLNNFDPFKKGNKIENRLIDLSLRGINKNDIVHVANMEIVQILVMEKNITSLNFLVSKIDFRSDFLNQENVNHDLLNDLNVQINIDFIVIEVFNNHKILVKILKEKIEEKVGLNIFKKKDEADIFYRNFIHKIGFIGLAKNDLNSEIKNYKRCKMNVFVG